MDGSVDGAAAIGGSVKWWVARSGFGALVTVGGGDVRVVAGEVKSRHSGGAEISHRHERVKLD